MHRIYYATHRATRHEATTVMALRDALCTNDHAAETAALLIADMGLDRREVAENFAAGTDRASRAVVRACRTAVGFRQGARHARQGLDPRPSRKWDAETTDAYLRGHYEEPNPGGRGDP